MVVRGSIRDQTFPFSGWKQGRGGLPRAKSNGPAQWAVGPGRWFAVRFVSRRPPSADRNRAAEPALSEVEGSGPKGRRPGIG
jgi:hypothetical protein